MKNGALIGMAVGGGLAAVAMAATLAYEDTAAGYVVGAALIYGGIGAGIGAGIDAMVEGRRVIYASSGSPATRLTIAPLLGGPRKGVLVSLRLTR